jgi:hypothetical protein
VDLGDRRQIVIALTPRGEAVREDPAARAAVHLGGVLAYRTEHGRSALSDALTGLERLHTAPGGSVRTLPEATTSCIGDPGPARAISGQPGRHNVLEEVDDGPAAH